MSADTQTDPPSLHDLQSWMQDCLLNPAGVNRHITPSNRLSAQQRLGIYQTSYINRLCKCLEEQFPALAYTLGQEVFEAFARTYLSDLPSDSYTLYALGRRFAGYLQDTRPDKDAPPDQQETWIDFMVDLASYERQLFVMFDAPGAEAMQGPDPRTSDTDLRLQPCFDLGHYRYPVAQFYHGVNADTRPDLPGAQVSHYALVRQNYITTSYPVSEVQHVFLGHLRSSHSIPTSLDWLSEAFSIPAEIVHSSWQEQARDTWIKAGFFVLKDQT